MATILLERNQELDGRTFQIPKNVADHLRSTLSQHQDDTDEQGYKRLNGLVNPDYNDRSSSKNANKTERSEENRVSRVSWKELNRIRNAFDNMSDKSENNIEYVLNGGRMMDDFVHSEIDRKQNQVRNMVKAEKSLNNSAKAPSVAKNPAKPSRTENGNEYVVEGKSKKKKRKTLKYPIGSIYTLTKSFDGAIYK